MMIMRPKPPSNASFAVYVENRWIDIRSRVIRDVNVSVSIDQLQIFLKQGRAQLAKGELRAGFDWETDLALAEELHALNLVWRETVTGNNVKLADFWKVLAEKQSDLAERMTISADVTPVFYPGATGIRSSLNAADERPSSSSFFCQRAA
jgi:hypothetical protein